MRRQLLRLAIAWIPALTAALVLGPIAGVMVHQLRGDAGGTDATLLVNESPIFGVAIALGVCALAVLAAWFGVRIGTPNVGLFSAGIVLTWAAARSGQIDEIVLVQRASPMPRLILEGLLVALLALIVAEVIRRFRRHSPAEPSVTMSVRAIGAGVIGAGLTAWLIAVEPMKGQTIGAAMAAGIMGASIARMVLLSIPPRTLVVIPALLAIAGPLSTDLIADDVVASTLDGTLFRLGWIPPLDWLAGSLMGIPIGLAWTETVVEQQSPKAEPESEPASDRPEPDSRETEPRETNSTQAGLPTVHRADY